MFSVIKSRRICAYRFFKKKVAATQVIPNGKATSERYLGWNRVVDIRIMPWLMNNAIRTMVPLKNGLTRAR